MYMDLLGNLWIFTVGSAVNFEIGWVVLFEVPHVPSLGETYIWYSSMACWVSWLIFYSESPSAFSFILELQSSLRLLGSILTKMTLEGWRLISSKRSACSRDFGYPSIRQSSPEEWIFLIWSKTLSTVFLSLMSLHSLSNFLSSGGREDSSLRTNYPQLKAMHWLGLWY